MTRRTPAGIGPVGQAVIANIERLRRERGLSLRKLSAALEDAGRPIGSTVLHAQSQGKRRIDADDLAAFAEVLGVTVTDLLDPAGPREHAPEHPAVRAARDLADRIADLAAAAGDPEAAARANGRADRAMRRVQLEVEDLLDATAADTGKGSS